jgi:hypothetical protein
MEEGGSRKERRDPARRYTKFCTSETVFNNCPVMFAKSQDLPVCISPAINLALEGRNVDPFLVVLERY